MKTLPVFALIFVFSFAYAQDNTERSPPVPPTEERHPMDELIFKVAVFGPADDIFIWWGHAALIVHNTRWNFSRVFDWGIFSYPSDSFTKDFILQRVSYRSAVGSLNLRAYINEDRDITIYTLNLDRRAKEIMLAYAENSVLPANRYYDYDQFRDNCATRIRDIIDMGTRGQFRAAFEDVPGRLSIRQHVRRFTWSKPFSEWFLCFMLGQYHDREISVWDEMFLPVEIARNITDFTWIDDYGVERQLVSSVELAYASKNRPPILNRPSPMWIFALKTGIIASQFFFFLRFLRRKFPRSGRILWGISQSVLGLFLGGIGCVLMFGKFFMNNDYFQQNFNLLFINPLLLFMIPLGILAALGKPVMKHPPRPLYEEFLLRLDPERCLRILWTYVFIAGSFTVLVRVLPFAYQQNQSVQGLILPVALALSGISDSAYRLKPLIRKLRKFTRKAAV